MIRKFLKGFVYAFNGVSYTFATQINFKIHTMIAAGAGLAGWYAGLSIAEWLWIITAVTLVIVIELLNTAVEILVDKISPEYDRMAGIIKDVSAAAVLLTAMLAFVIGLAIFIPKFF